MNMEETTYDGATPVMTPALRAALVAAAEHEWADWPEQLTRVLAVIEATPDGPVDMTDYEVDGEENERHIVASISYFGLGHLAV